MAQQNLSRALQPAEIPEHPGEALPLATTVSRRMHGAKAYAGGAEHRAGVQGQEQELEGEGAESGEAGPRPPREDPPRGRKPAGGA